MAGCLTELRCVREQQGESEETLARAAQAQELCQRCGSGPTVHEKGQQSMSGYSNQAQQLSHDSRQVSSDKAGPRSSHCGKSVSECASIRVCAQAQAWLRASSGWELLKSLSLKGAPE